MAVPSGRHVVTFRYEPLALRLGALVSMATALALAAALVDDVRRRR